MNPEVKKTEEDNLDDNKNLPSEDILPDNLAHVWKQYALKVKREKQDSLFSIINGAIPKLDSNLVITIEINNTIAAKEFDNCKPEFITFLRSKLKNYKINIEYFITESTKIEFSDNKSKFEKLVKENGSLDKFRKLFNLDVEF
tara:strand:+ start:578 stop:1006 length:429 start_codon:yes stop_codon:yes gene_type:complete